MTRSLTALVLPLLLSGCLVGTFGSGDLATETRDAPGADAFANASFIDVSVETGAPVGQIDISCDDNLLDEIITEVDGGVLVLRTRPGVNLVPRAHCTAFVSLPELHSVVNSGSGSLDVDSDVVDLFEIEGTGSGALRMPGMATGVERVRSLGSGAVELGAVRACDLDLEHTGSGRVVVEDLSSCTLDLMATGSGRTLLSGDVQSADIQLSGSGGLGDVDLVVDEADIVVLGSGGVEMTVLDRVSVRLTGSGGARIHGDPAQREISELGSGRVRFE